MGCGAGFVVVVPVGFVGAETATHFGMKLEKVWTSERVRFLELH